MSQSIASFLNGLTDGYQTRRKMKAEDEDAEWTRGRRTRQVVLDGQEDEDRERNNSWTDETRSRERTTWTHADEDRSTRIANDAEDREWTRGRRGRQVTLDGREDYAHDRQIAADQSEDAFREEVAAASAAANAAYQADQAHQTQINTPPVVEGTAPAAPPVPAEAPASPAAPATRSFSNATPQGAEQPAMIPADPVAPAAPQAAAPDQAAPAAPTGRALPAAVAPPEERARRSAAAAKSMMQHYREVAGPRIQQAYLANGEVEKAQVFEKFLQTGQTQEALTHWSNAIGAAQLGDGKRFADSLQKAYNVRGYFDDGISAVPEESVIEQDPDTGRMTGKIVFVDDNTGVRSEMEFDGLDDLYRAGIGLLSPEQVFERGLQQADAAAERRQALIDAQLKDDGSSDYDRISETVEMIAKTPEGMSMTLEQQVEAAKAYLRQFDRKGRVVEIEEPAADGAEGADVPVFLR